MNVDIQFKPSNTAAKIHLDMGEECITEAGAMIAMSGPVNITTSTHKKQKGSFLKAIKRGLAGESFFLNHYDAKGPSEIWISGNLSGDIEEVNIEDKGLIIQGGSFLACASTVDVDMSWQGFKSLFSGESVFWLKTSGKGKVLLSSFGSIYCVHVEDGYYVDTGHIVAFEDTLKFNISKAGGSWFHSFLGGEGLVCHFTGSGKVWCQSHDPDAFGRSLTPHLRPRKEN